ncbi:MunI family type II restriction endonuclease [Glaesserella parasuis]|nr:MunI family type II restriction endonuclease [Glaesserella parasuis]
MASNELRNRSNWQTLSGEKARKAEDLFHLGLQKALDEVYPKQFLVQKHPDDFSEIYSTFDLPQEVKDKIYDINTQECNSKGKKKYKWGIKMDFAIRNIQNGKTLFGEIKRQDGWVENTSPSAGRGNAHERSAKYFTPGLQRVLREKSKISEDIQPFWLVLVGDITRDPKRNREIAFWYQGYEKNFYMWQDTDNLGDLLDFFENNLLKYLL